MSSHPSLTRGKEVLTLDQSLHHLLPLLLFAVVPQECAESPSCLLLHRQHFLQPQQAELPVCHLGHTYGIVSVSARLPVLTLVVRMMKMRGEKLWCSSSPGSSLARQLYRCSSFSCSRQRREHPTFCSASSSVDSNSGN